MTNNDIQPREALEKLFPEPFTDYQWSMLAAAGYEEALASGAGTPNEVAQEIKDLKAAAVEASSGPGQHPPYRRSESSLTWEQMERLVLGRILNSSRASGPKTTSSSPSGGVKPRRLDAYRQRGHRRISVVIGSCVAALAIVVAAVLVFFGPAWGLWGASPLPTTTTFNAATSENDTSVGGLLGSTTSSLPPSTIPPLEPTVYTAELSGANEVPAVETSASGTLELTLSDDGLTAQYVLSVQKLSNLTVARLRVGAAGVNGEEIVTIYPGPNKKGSFTGVVAEMSFTAADFVGPLEGLTMTDFIALVESGRVYVNLGTTKNRDGELRGQLGP
jgi:hypothetical protein